MLAAASISPLWYISRSAGYVGLILLALIGVLGIMTAGDIRLARGNKFVTPELHRSLSLLAIVVLAIHVGAAIADKYSFIGFKDVFLPFTATYRPVWIGIGAIAVDLGIAVVITSLLRVKMGYRSWKLIHWASYPIFGLSIIHGLGSGTDSALWFSKFVYLVVGGVFILAIIARLVSLTNLNLGKQVAFFGMSFAVPVAIVAWAVSGPLASNWPKRAQVGLSQTILTSAQVTSSPSTTPFKATSSTPGPLKISSNYTSNWSGSIDQSPSNSQGEIALRLLGMLSGSPGYELSIVLFGIPSDGGVSMISSLVEIASTSGSVVYKGSVTSLSGTTIISQVANASGQSVTFSASLNLGSNGSSFTGTVAGSSNSQFSNGLTSNNSGSSEQGNR